MVTIDEVVRDTWRALVPVRCVGCQSPHQVLCLGCEQSLHNAPLEASLALRRYLYDKPVIAAGAYQGVLRNTILAFKDHGYRSLAKPLGRLLSLALENYLTAEPNLLVPIPSAFGGWLRRGFEPAKTLAKELAAHSVTSQVATVLVPLAMSELRNPRPRKTMPRSTRLHTSPTFRVRRMPANYPVWLVDDVATTGVSLEAAACTLQQAGVDVRGAVVVAASHTRPLHTRSENTRM